MQLLHPRVVSLAFSSTTRHIQCIRKANQGTSRRKCVHSQVSGTQGRLVSGFFLPGSPYTVDRIIQSVLMFCLLLQKITLMLEFDSRTKDEKQVSVGNRIFDT